MVSRLADSGDYVSVVLAGEAGQGIQTVEYILTRVLKLSGYNVFSSKEYMSRIRGGTNSTEIRISSRRVSSFVDQIDILIPLSKGALQHLRERVSPETIILGDKENFNREYGGSKDMTIDMPLSQIASDVGSRIYSNTVAVGVLSGVLNVEINILEGYLKKHFSAKGEEAIQKNIEAARKGYQMGTDLVTSGKIGIEIEKNVKVTNEILLNGAEAVALGAIGGGCNFVSFYPMSPSTSVAVFLAHYSRDFDIVVEQVEDEISAMNMAVGAWYAGARAMVTTSGCGNFSILRTLKQALSELEIKPEKLVIVSGIGQAAKTPHYLKANIFNGLHGRSLPAASTIKAANPGLTVIAESGDGCMYAEGGNHLIHAIRRNPDITTIVHNNMVYGLTKGQASPTSEEGFRTPIQVKGVFVDPFNPVAVAVSLDASFVARAFSKDEEKTKEILKKAIIHKGFALVDILQPCLTYNKVNTYKWFKEHTYYLDGSYDPHHRQEAFKRATEKDKLPLGILYVNPHKSTFEENIGIYEKSTDPLYKREPDMRKLGNLIELRRSM